MASDNPVATNTPTIGTPTTSTGAGGTALQPNMGPSVGNPTPTSIVGNGQVGPLAPATPSTLPTPQNTGTATTGVASSGLADTTLQTQKSGFDNLSGMVQNQQQTKATNAANPKVSIVDLLNSKGFPSDFSTRAKVAKVAGIQDYVGTADQNAQLIGWINSGGSLTAPNTQSTTQSGSPTSSTGTPTPTGNTPPNTGSPGDVYSQAITDNEKSSGDLVDSFKTATDQMMNGTFPLSASQQAVLDATQKQFDVTIKAQLVANRSYENSVALANNRLGMNIGNPKEYFAEQQQAISDDLNKVNTLDATAAKTMADLKQGFMDKDFTEINDQYTALQNNLKDKADALEKLQSRVDSLYTSTRDYNEKIDEFQKSQAQQKAEFEQTQGLELKKLALSYPGLDTNTGQLATGTDPTTLPGITSLPSAVGGHYLDVAQIKSSAPGYVSALEKIAKANGYGVVDTDNNKTFNQSLNAFTGLQGEISSGALNGNDLISNDVQQKKSSSTIQRLFGSTQPDAIATVLGAGGAQIPNLENMTWNQALPYLQSNLFNAMGTQPETQQATSAFNTASTTANHGVSSSITQNPIIQSNMSSVGL